MGLVDGLWMLFFMASNTALGYGILKGSKVSTVPQLVMLLANIILNYSSIITNLVAD